MQTDRFAQVGDLPRPGAFERARAQGLLETDPARFKPTLQGQRFLNDLPELFLAA